MVSSRLLWIVLAMLVAEGGRSAGTSALFQANLVYLSELGTHEPMDRVD